jgi:peptidoglycan hydrolase-like protein with peptidoglycan-binding domain
MPAWPSPPTPGTLPPFPGPGWCPDTPVSQTVAARAAYWNPQLWDYPSKTVRKAYVQEQLGGSWVTFAAAWHPGNSGPQTYMATEAWKVCAAPPIAPVTPPPMPAPAVVPTPTQKPGPIGPEPAPGAWQTNSAYIKRYQAALSYLAHAIPMPSLDPLGVDGKFGPNTKNAVMNYQRAHGLTVDGEVGNATAASIDQTMGYAVPGHAVPAPGQAPTPAPATPPAGPPGLVSPYPGPGAYATNSQYIARVQNALTWLSGTKGVGAWNPQGVDGKDGPHTRAAVKAFQSAHGLTADGMAGAATAAALDAALSSP